MIEPNKIIDSIFSNLITLLPKINWMRENTAQKFTNFGGKSEYLIARRGKKHIEKRTKDPLKRNDLKIENVEQYDMIYSEYSYNIHSP